MKANDAYRALKTRLQEAGIEEAGPEADLFLQHVAGAGRFDVTEVSEDQWQALQALTAKRAGRYPLQYLLGSWPFMGLHLAVGQGVLIPRPETELVCQAAIDSLRGVTAPQVLDLCAGTGALALGIAHALPSAAVAALECSPEAFAWLEKNRKEYGKTHKNAPTVILADVFAYHTRLSPQGLDLIVSNPPYVTEVEYAALAPELRCEPKQALVAEQEGLAFYTAIARDYAPALKPGGALVFEIGAGQGTAVRAILESNGYSNIDVQKDFSGHDRIAVARRG